MRRSGVYNHMARPLVLLVFALVPHLTAAQVASTRTTVCEIAAHPQTFSGRIVTVRANVIAGFEVFAIEDPSDKCERMWLKYAGSGPTAMVSMGNKIPSRGTIPIELNRDAEFDKFTDLLVAKMYPRFRGDVCVARNRYQVSATFTGRVDLAPQGTGFGHLNAYSLQFETQSVADATGKDLAGDTDVCYPVGYLKGMVRSFSGAPVAVIEVDATRTDEVSHYPRQVKRWTDDEGKFRLDVPPGSYILGVNPDAESQCPPTYYPSTAERASATVLTVEDGQTINADLTIPNPKLAVRNDVTFRVEWPDGKPAGGILVWLSEPRSPYSGRAQSAHTDERGMTIVPAFEGFDYIAHAEINVFHPNSYEHFCAHPVRIDPAGTGRDVVLKLSIKGEKACLDVNR